MTIILGLESSCDDSAAALVTGEPISWPKLVAAALVNSGVLYAGTKPRRALATAP